MPNLIFEINKAGHIISNTNLNIQYFIMILDLKNIHIGNLIHECAAEKGFDSLRICKYLKCTDLEWKSIQSQKSLDSEIILRLSTLFEYDFFRVYSQHLILYAPTSNAYTDTSSRKSSLPYYRKNIYTKEVIYFILEQINKGNKTKSQVINEYRIPKTTLYKWINKYNQKED